MAWLALALVPSAVVAQEDLEPGQPDPTASSSAPAEEIPDEELATPDLPAPTPAQPAEKAPVGRGGQALSVLVATAGLGAACGTCGLLCSSAVGFPVACICCGLGQAPWWLGWIYAGCLTAVPIQLAGSILLAVAMPMAATLGAAATGYHRAVRLGLVKVWLLSAGAALAAVVFGLVGTGVLVGVGLGAGYMAVLSGGVGHPPVLYGLWVVFAGALALAGVFPVGVAIAAQLAPALLTLGLTGVEQAK